MIYNFKWKVKTGSFASGESLYLNRIRLGEYGWDAGRSRDKVPRDPNYIGTITLPSLKNNRVLDDSIEVIKTKIEMIVANWFEEALKED